MPKKVLCIIGTRPEVIKMAPVIRSLRDTPGLDVTVLASGQHREMLVPLIDWFDLRIDADLQVMTDNQSLAALTARLMQAFDRQFTTERPDLVLAQGDTTTVMCAALSCFYLNIPFGHVEAGLRTFDIRNPFPEEMNRTVASRLARFHFAPTAAARANLLAEGIPDAAIHVTGNTVIDALLQVAERDVPIGPALDETKRLVLVTAHRRESFGLPLRQAFGALRALADRNEDVQVLYPVHMNPNVSGPARELLSGHPRIVLSSRWNTRPSCPR